MEPVSPFTCYKTVMLVDTGLEVCYSDLEQAAQCSLTDENPQTMP